jgi:hypothetical protein
VRLDWLRWCILLVSIVFASVTLFTGLDWLAYHYNTRLREYQAASVYGYTSACYAAKGLSQSSLSSVERQLKTVFYMRPGTPGPVYYLQGITMDIPVEFIADFFYEAAKLDTGFLPAVRDGNSIGGGDGWVDGVALATDFTNVLKRDGCADVARGTHAAVLTEPLEAVAKRYGVEL